MRESLKKVLPRRALLRTFVLTGLASVLLGSQSQATVILAYGQSTNALAKTLTVAKDGSATLTGTSIPITITTLGGFASTISALEDISAHSVGAATFNPTTGAISQPFDGTVSFTAGGINYLTAVFQNLTMTSTNNLSGTNKSPAINLGAAQPPQLLTLTSDVLPPSDLTPPVAMSLSMTLNKALTWNSTTGQITAGTYKASESGVFTQTTAVPEPSSLLVAGIGGLGLIGYGLSRRKAQGA
jgi:hypothetical protein